MEGLENYLLGQTDEHLSISTREECRQLSLAMAQQARRSLNIFSYNLEPALYDTPSFYDAARHLIGVDTNSLIRILVYDVSGTVNKGHRLGGQGDNRRPLVLRVRPAGARLRGGG